jgi:hypothetical protein
MSAEDKDVSMSGMAKEVVPSEEPDTRKDDYRRDRRLQELYLFFLATVFLIAFASYYVQFPGLLSNAGLEPVQRVLPNYFPLVHKLLILADWIDADSLCELVAISGIFLSGLVIR